MPLSDWLNSSAALQRLTPTLDASGGTVPAFTTVAGKGTLSCGVYPVGSGMATQFRQYVIAGDYVILFAANAGALPGDRLSIGGIFYKVNGLLPFANPRRGGTSVYAIDATLITKS
jgi:hypothetical protein